MLPVSAVYASLLSLPSAAQFRLFYAPRFGILLGQEIMTVVRAVAWCVHVSGICAGGSDDADGVGDGDDDGAGDVDDEHDDDGDEDDDYYHHHQPHHCHCQSSASAIAQRRGGGRPPPALHRLPDRGRLDDNDSNIHGYPSI